MAIKKGKTTVPKGPKGPKATKSSAEPIVRKKKRAIVTLKVKGDAIDLTGNGDKQGSKEGKDVISWPIRLCIRS